ncbi:MAG: zinc-ribbon domain-containing protein [Planctomycetales bacterium]|nr:zinc-ribbon domain-containing protein [Planctomycetales bacterium]
MAEPTYELQHPVAGPGAGSAADRLMLCVGCGRPFVFTASEQRFFAEKGLNVPPKRCLGCRRERKRGSGGASFSVTCSRCWRPFTVPFPPRSGASFTCETCAAGARA